MKSLLLGGYFGCGNLGDDAILLGFIQGLAPYGCSVTVLSGSPEATHRNYGLRAIPRKDLSAIRVALAEHDALIFPGGSILQDASSWRSPIYYAGLVREATKARKPVLWLGQGVGPLRTWLGRRAAASALKPARAIVVRDPDSARVVQQLCGKTAPLAADLAFLLPPLERSGEAFSAGGMPTVGLIPRPVKGVDIVPIFVGIARGLFAEGFAPTFVELDSEKDGPLIQAIDAAAGGKIPSIRRISTPMELQRRLARMHAVVTVRLHGGILASTVGTPSVLLDYDPKVRALGQALNLPTLKIGPNTAAEALKALKGVDQLRASLTAGVSTQREAAQRNLSLMAGALGLSLRG